MKVHSDFDPIELEILWSRLVSVVDEAAVALLRTAFSTVVRESNDFTMVLMDADCASIADTNVGTPSFVGILPQDFSANALSAYRSTNGRRVIASSPTIRG